MHKIFSYRMNFKEITWTHENFTNLNLDTYRKNELFQYAVELLLMTGTEFCQPINFLNWLGNDDGYIREDLFGDWWSVITKYPVSKFSLTRKDPTEYETDTFDLEEKALHLGHKHISWYILSHNCHLIALFLTLAILKIQNHNIANLRYVNGDGHSFIFDIVSNTIYDPYWTTEELKYIEECTLYELKCLEEVFSNYIMSLPKMLIKNYLNLIV